ncbi:uncharacterized protein LOC126319886 isoform X2 [Schistocerca gregaria]|uniref:uncharacterized protein LOC126319886 isoform X2 n=1 Tax=Schistocerca gregaria TaxID=7010 RepID=UPI00211F1D3D|nr:uncharacterized protein LOC126319886 isoform X2 [Schistocerca gregaria]
MKPSKKFLNELLYLDIDESKRPPITKNEIEILLSCDPCEEVYKVLGDLARKDVNRYFMVEAGAIESVAEGLKHGNEELDLNALRVIANLCYDNGSFAFLAIDEGRSRVKKMPGTLELIANMLWSKRIDKLRIAIGCIANLSSDTEDICGFFLQYPNALDRLIELGNYELSEVSTMALQALGNLGCTESQCDQIFKAGGFHMAIELLKNPDLNTIREALYVTSSLIASKEVADYFFEQDGIQILYQCITRYENAGFDKDPQDVKDAIKKTFDFLIDIAENRHYHTHFADESLINQLFDWVDHSSCSEIVDMSAGVIRRISVESDIRDKIYPRIPILMDWLRNSDKYEVKLTAAVTLGSFSHDDKSSSEMIERGIPELLLEVLDSQMNVLKAKSQSLTDAAIASENENKVLRLKHVCVCNLRNLSFCASHKKILLDQGLMKFFPDLFREKNEVLAHASILLLKNLLFAGQVSIDELAKHDPQFESLLNLTHAGEGQKCDHVFYEASRAVNVLIQNADSSFKIRIIRDPVIGRKILAAINNLVQSKYDILQNEGIESYLSILQFDSLRESVLSELHRLLPNLTQKLTEILENRITNDSSKKDSDENTENDQKKIKMYESCSRLLEILSNGETSKG